MIQRKCRNCGTWNDEEDYCKSCQSSLSPLALEKEKDALRKQEEETRTPSNFELWLGRIENHKFFLVRLFYKILRSIGIIFTFFGVFFAWLAALANA
jgi:methionyl-tRNA synthetase